jgi:hypothetical protein
LPPPFRRAALAFTVVAKSRRMESPQRPAASDRARGAAGRAAGCRLQPPVCCGPKGGPAGGFDVEYAPPYRDVAVWRRTGCTLFFFERRESNINEFN